MDERIPLYLFKGVLLAILIFYIVQMVEFLVAIIYGWRKLYTKPRRLDPEAGVPGVSIIKPLMGLDPCLADNLESHFTLHYPSFEILFCCHSDSDPAINVVNNLAEKYPNVDYQIFISEEYTVTNPMVQNMLPAYLNAKYDLLWVSTSRICASTDILLDLVERSQPEKVGLVHQMPYIFTHPKRDLNSWQQVLLTVEKIYFGSCLARHFLVADFIGYGLFCGMSYMTKKSVLTLIGGFEELGKFIAEDYFMEKLVHAKGYHTGLSSYPAQQHTLPTSLVSYKDRLVRWTRLRIQLAPIITLLLEPVTNALSMGCLSALALYHFLGVHPAFFFPLHLLVWITLDRKMVNCTENRSSDASLCTFLAAWFVRDLMSYYIMFEALLNPFTIKWGRSSYWVNFGGRTTKLPTCSATLDA